MSVLCLPNERIELAINTLFREAHTIMILKDVEGFVGDINTYTICLFDRLSMANQMAYHYQYTKEETFSIDRLDFNKNLDVPTEDVDFRSVALTLKSLRYNLYNNNGRSFVSKEDLDALNVLIEATKPRADYKTQEEIKSEQDMIESYID